MKLEVPTFKHPFNTNPKLFVQRTKTERRKMVSTKLRCLGKCSNDTCRPK